MLMCDRHQGYEYLPTIKSIMTCTVIVIIYLTIYKTSGRLLGCYDDVPKRSTPAHFKWLFMAPSTDYRKFQQDLAKARNVLVFTGAGISEDVGVPTYSESINYWREYNLRIVTHINTFLRVPSITWEFYHEIREKSLEAKPSKGHILLAKLEERMKIDDKIVRIITTNIDGLHSQAGSENALEIYGSVIRTKCTVCGNITINRDSPICPALEYREFCTEKYRDYPQIPEHDLPHCKIPGCGGLLRPDVVFHGEEISDEHFTLANKWMKECDFGLVIGMSFHVWPVGLWPYYLTKDNITVAEFNTRFTKFTADFKYMFKGPCNKTLKIALSQGIRPSVTIRYR